jgi:hypothetical protein
LPPFWNRMKIFCFSCIIYILKDMADDKTKFVCPFLFCNYLKFVLRWRKMELWEKDVFPTEIIDIVVLINIILCKKTAGLGKKNIDIYFFFNTKSFIVQKQYMYNNSTTFSYTKRVAAPIIKQLRNVNWNYYIYISTSSVISRNMWTIMSY